MKEKIKFFPITAFAVIMGLTGLTIVLSKFYHFQWLPYFVFESMLIIVSLLFLIIFFLYILKTLWFSEEVKTDFKHRIRINFFSAISISFLLLSIAYQSYLPLLSVPLWWLGTILHTFFMFSTISFWIQHNFEIHHFNPAWFIPVVGNILIPISGVDYAPYLISYFYFVIGFFFWIVLFTIFMYRVVFHSQMPEKFIPTFFILMAPPAVGFISYIRISVSWDMFSLFLLFMTYFFIILLAVMYRSFNKIKFFMSWWAFTFPLTASSVASVLAYHISGIVVFKYIAWLMLLISVIAIAIVIKQTIIHIIKGEICIKED